jgi:hypothetical protein
MRTGILGTRTDLRTKSIQIIINYSEVYLAEDEA